MEVRTKIRYFLFNSRNETFLLAPLPLLPLLPLLFGLLSGCARPRTAETVFPKTSATCQGEALPQRYIVRWSDGHISLQTGKNREELLKIFVEPNLNQLHLVEPDFRVKIPSSSSSLLSPTSVETTPDMADNWGAVAVQADQAWAAGAKGSGITVAVVDTGLDIHHEQLKNQVDHNGYSFVHDSPDVEDHFAHGTHVSGIIAGQHFDTMAGPQNHVQGLAPESKILPLQFIDSDDGGSLYDAMRAIDYAVLHQARIINASWGGTLCSTLLRDLIASLHDKGVFFITAAGNSGNNLDLYPEFPAAFLLPAQITVGATGPFDNRADFSNYSEIHVHIFAPGVHIISTLPHNEIGPMSGTSMATPFVSGAIAALLSLRPEATIEQIRQALYASAKQDQFYRNASHGRLNLNMAVDVLKKILPASQSQLDEDIKLRGSF